MKTTKELPGYFGKYGGFYVPDPFTPALDMVAQKFNELKGDAKLAELQKQVVSQSDVVGDAEVGADSTVTVKVDLEMALIAGYFAIAKLLEQTPVVGIDEKGQVDKVLKAADKLGYPGYVVLSKALGADKALVQRLSDKGFEVETEKCATLFDDVNMYAFQRFITNPMKNMFVPLAPNVGPYPFLAITQFLIKQYANGLNEKAKGVDACLAKAAPGNAASLMLNAFNGSVECFTYEPSFDDTREDCYCGALTKVAIVNGKEIVLSPELVNAWDEKKAGRIFAASTADALSNIKGKNKILVLED